MVLNPGSLRCAAWSISSHIIASIWFQVGVPAGNGAALMLPFFSGRISRTDNPENRRGMRDIHPSAQFKITFPLFPLRIISKPFS
jgi:hypothetical protein